MPRRQLTHPSRCELHPALGPLMVLQVPRRRIADRLGCAESTVGVYFRGEKALPEALAATLTELAREQVRAHVTILQVIVHLEPALIRTEQINNYARTVSFAHELAFGEAWSPLPDNNKNEEGAA